MLAPWGITHRYVGTEPDCVVTRHYNQQMKDWLTRSDVKAPPVKVVEIKRKSTAGEPVSASSVRRLLETGEGERLATFLPRTSIDYIREHLPQKMRRSDMLVAAQAVLKPVSEEKVFQ